MPFPPPGCCSQTGSASRSGRRELDLDLDRRVEVFDRLDGFGEVDVAITDSQAGPFALESFELRREAPGPYALVSSAETTLAALDRRRDRQPRPAVPRWRRRPTPLGDTGATIPIELDMVLTSSDGQVEVVSGGGTVAGFPTGPLAELITAAIVDQL